MENSEIMFERSHRRHKRSHDEMQTSTSRRPSFNILSQQPSSSSYPNMPASSHSVRPSLSFPQLRYPGDGLDMRRPVDIIDLTSEPDPVPSNQAQTSRQSQTRPVPLPRFEREIIDLSADSGINATPHTNAPNAPLSPELEFVSSRPISRPQSRSNAGRFRSSLLRLHEVDFSREGRPDMRRVNPLSNSIFWGIEGIQHFMNPDNYFGTFEPPGELNYEQVPFNISEENDDFAAQTSYSAPEPAPAGFTRSPEEDEIILCPNCGDELCTGESDLKKQVWIIKGCGHVYCGECTDARHKSKRKGKNTDKTFKECVVEGCKKKCSSKNQMLQLFL